MSELSGAFLSLSGLCQVGIAIDVLLGLIVLVVEDHLLHGRPVEDVSGISRRVERGVVVEVPLRDHEPQVLGDHAVGSPVFLFQGAFCAHDIGAVGLHLRGWPILVKYFVVVHAANIRRGKATEGIAMEV